MKKVAFTFILTLAALLVGIGGRFLIDGWRPKEPPSFTSDTHSSPPQVNTFSETIGGGGAWSGIDVSELLSGDYIVGGLMRGSKAQGVFARISKDGALVWAKSVDAIVFAVTGTSDQGYVVASYAITEGQAFVTISKFSSNDVLEWARALPDVSPVGIGGSILSARSSIIQSSDSGYVLTGTYTKSNSLFIAKLSSSGDLRWMKTLGSNGTYQGKSVSESPDGGYVVVGSALRFNQLNNPTKRVYTSLAMREATRFRQTYK